MIASLLTAVACSTTTTTAIAPPTTAVTNTSAPPATPPPTSATSSSQRQANSGTIAAINGNTLTLTTSQGQLTVNVSSGTTIDKTAHGTTSDLSAGQFVVITGTAGSNGNVSATSIVIQPGQSGQFSPPAGSGTRANFTRPTGTPNGSRTGSGAEQQFIIGTISQVNGNVLTVTTRQGQTTVSIGSGTAIEKTVSITVSDLSTGDVLTVFGPAASDGAVNATAITVRSPASPPSSSPANTTGQSSSSSASSTSYHVGLYTDVACTNPVSTINWGNLAQGTSSTETIFIKNVDNQTATVSASANITTSGLTMTNSGPINMIPGSLGPSVYELQLSLSAAANAAPGDASFTIIFAGVTPVSVPNQVTVVPTLSAIKIVPVSPDNSADLVVGATQQFKATGTNADGSTADISSAVTWNIDNPSVATIDSSGLATGISNGTANITATLSGVTSLPVSLTVVAATPTSTATSSAPTLSSITIMPAAPANLQLNSTQQFTAKAIYSDGSSRDVTAQALWLSSNINVATTSASGAVTGAGAGTTDITATLSGVISPAVTLTVGP